MLIHVAACSYNHLLMLCSVLLYDYITLYIFICLLMDIWVLSNVCYYKQGRYKHAQMCLLKPKWTWFYFLYFNVLHNDLSLSCTNDFVVCVCWGALTQHPRPLRRAVHGNGGSAPLVHEGPKNSQVPVQATDVREL